MATEPVSRRIEGVAATLGPTLQFFTTSAWARRQGDPGIADFALGNPHEMPLPAFANALARWSAPQNKDWFAYTTSEPAAQELVAQTLRERYAVPFEAQDIFMTNGAFAAIAAALAAIVDPGDQVIFISPPWFFYEALIVAAGAQAVRVPADPLSFDLDLDSIAAAITERTRAILVNSPNNPTGRIYPPETLKQLASVLSTASERNGRPICLLSDEAYSRIIFDGRHYDSPTAFYPYALLLYTYGKTLLTPGQRMGYIALPPSMPGRERLRPALLLAQIITGYAFPNALLQHALPDLEGLSIDIAHLQRKRDRLTTALRAMGYQVNLPEGAFYLLARSPIPDDRAFTELLAEQNVFVLPGAVVDLPGYFRISLTANDEMIERALPGFQAALQHPNSEESV
jgi:aspartate aminotransferase